MTKKEFLEKLEDAIKELPRAEIEEHLIFYREMIDDRIEEGVSEEDAVAKLGNIKDIASQILGDLEKRKSEKEAVKKADEKDENDDSASSEPPKTKKRKLKVWEIVLIILAAPAALSILFSAVSVVISIYTALWSVAISFWASFGALCALAPTGIVLAVASFIEAKAVSGIAYIGGALFCVGLAILMYFVSLLSTKWLVWLTKQCVVWTRTLIVKIFRQEDNV